MTWHGFPITCQAYADMACSRFDQTFHKHGPLMYGKTHEVVERFGELKHPCVLVTSSSDLSVTEEHAAKLPKCVLHWFSNNVQVEDPRITNTPIGFRYSFEQIQKLIAVSMTPRPPQEKLLLLCFNRNLPYPPQHRVGLYEYFGQFDWVTCQGGATGEVPFDQYLHLMRSHPFVLSPAGCGPDCHRTWEALALGSIPIVTKSFHSHLYDDMPVWQLNNWDEVTKGRLEGCLDFFKMRFGWASMEKLNFAYWGTQILAHLA